MTTGASRERIRLRIDPSESLVTILDEGEVDVLSLYRQIREWEASEEGIVFDQVLDGSGNIELPDGTRTPRVIVFVNGWRLAAESPVALVGGYVAGRDADGQGSDPIAADSRERVRLLTDAEVLDDAAPLEPRVRHALALADRFAEDWDINEETREVFRRDGASDETHSVYALYWYLKQEYLRRSEVLSKYRFPIEYTESSTGERSYTWAPPWTIRQADLLHLSDGPLTRDGVELVASRGSRDAIDEDAITVGIVTALPKELAAVRSHLSQDQSLHGTSGTFYKAGLMEAFDGGSHTVAVSISRPGNNSAAIRAAHLCTDFPNLGFILMVGIAGAVPSPDDPDKHVRLGDIVVSGPQGVIQYDFVKESEDRSEPRHLSRPPGSRLLEVVSHFEADSLMGQQQWLERLDATENLPESTRPDDSTDRLASSDDPGHVIGHPTDPRRTPGQPRLFVGAIGAANRLLRNPVRRDELRDRFEVRAIEMEGAGIADATFDFEIPYLVIRGTCDYCDGNKDDRWQGYAAAIAAAFAAGLLAEIPG